MAYFQPGRIFKAHTDPQRGTRAEGEVPGAAPRLPGLGRADLVLVLTHVRPARPLVTAETMEVNAYGVYRIYDDDDALTLLYVGSSKNPRARVPQHSGLLLHASHFTVTPYPGKEAALTAEVSAIRCEHPALNMKDALHVDDCCRVIRERTYARYRAWREDNRDVPSPPTPDWAYQALLAWPTIGILIACPRVYVMLPSAAL